LSCAASAQAQADITVDVATSAGTVNPLLFGNNVPYAGNAGMLWDVRTNDLQAGAKPFIQTLAPTVLRFPGGSITDEYFWEDGLGYKTIAPVSWGASSVSLEAVPDWGTVSSAVFLDRTLTEDWWLYGDAFTFTGLTGTHLTGVPSIGAQHAVGVEVRPGPRQGQASWFSNQYGIDEHMTLVGSFGARAIITVNYGSGRTPAGALSTAVSLEQKVKRAAAWVAYLNGSPSDGRAIGVDPEGHDWKTVGSWAQKRVDRGHPAPYGVIYWEIGNEIYGSWERGFTTVRTYAHDVIAFATTMKAIDPAIKVAAVTWAEPHYLGQADTTDEWAPTLVQLAGHVIDALVVHLYYPAASTSYTSAPWLTATMAAAQQVVADLATLRTVIAANSGRASQIELFVTEYGIMPLTGGAREYSSLAGSLYGADLLMTLLHHPELKVTLATAWTLHDTSTELAAIHYDWNTATRWARPQYYTLELLRNSLAPALHTASVTSPTFNAAQVGNVAYTTAIPTLAALASTDDAGRLTLLVLNRSLSSALSTSIHLAGYTPQPTATVRTVTGNSLAAQNEDTHSTVVLATTTIASAAPTFSYTFPARSLTLIEFRASSPPASPPAAPSNLLAVALSASQARLTWTENASNETGVKIERKTGSTGTFAPIGTQAANSTSFNDSGLAASATYCYQVRTTSGAGDSPPSNEACTTTQPPPTPPTAVISIASLERRAPMAVTFDASASAAAGTTQIVAYNWNMGDGSTKTGLAVPYTYASPGTYTVTLTVTDSAGLTGTASTTIKWGRKKI
jgi:alpha-L-arabinofuranosidase/chitodextrinase